MVLYIGLSSFEIILVLLKGKKGWSHHLFKRISWKKKQKEAIQVLATPKATEGTTFKELAPKNFVRDLRA